MNFYLATYGTFTILLNKTVVVRKISSCLCENYWCLKYWCLILYQAKVLNIFSEFWAQQKILKLKMLVLPSKTQQPEAPKRFEWKYKPKITQIIWNKMWLMLNLGHTFCSILFDTVHPLNGCRNEAKIYRGLLRRISAEVAAGGLEGGRDHYAFGGQLPVHSATFLNMWVCNIQGIPSVFQALGSLAQWNADRDMISGFMQYHWSLNYFHYHFQKELLPRLKLLHIQLRYSRFALREGTFYRYSQKKKKKTKLHMRSIKHVLKQLDPR